MIEFLLNLDRDLLLLINGWNAPWLDSFMVTLTNGLKWSPLFLIVIGMMICKFRWQSIVMLIFVALVIFLTDRISAGLIKPWIGRLRPSHEPGLEGLLHLVNGYKGGLYSFVSSHAANAFGVATFLWLVLRKNIKWIWVMFIWAAIFSYTRIYLGVHYPFDILGGGVLGTIIGLLVYKIGRVVPKKLSPIPAAAEPPTS
jgi:undecaprenyl-diphosphatase